MIVAVLVVFVNTTLRFLMSLTLSQARVNNGGYNQDDLIREENR